MSLRIFPAILIALLVLGAAMNAAAKIDIDDITVTLSEDDRDTGDDSLTLDVGSDFYVQINLEGPDGDEDNVDLDIEIKIDGTVVYDDSESVDLVEDDDYLITIASGDLEENDAFESNLMAYDCGKSKVEVTVSGDIKTRRSDSATIRFEGDDLNVDIGPSDPQPSEEITVTVTDEDDDELKGITVRFTNLGSDGDWDEKDDYVDDKTDSDGEVQITLSEEDEFESKPYGKYQVDVWEEGGEYCKYTTTIDSRHTLRIGSIEPSAPMPGENIKLRVTDDDDEPVAGAKVGVSKQGVVSTYTTDVQGYIIFKSDVSGTFDLVATKTDYIDSDIKSITIQEKGAMKIELTPSSNIPAGSEMQIKVTGGDGSPLKGARVVITKPDKSTVDVVTSSAGTASYKPDAPGAYSLKVESPLYTAGTKEFKAYNAFKVKVPENLLPDTDITITVQDSLDNPVPGAVVSITETGITGTTDSSGKYTFSLVDAKTYTLKVKKDNYLETEMRINVRGIVSIRLSAKDIELGEEMEMVMQDSRGNPIDAAVEVTTPDGVKESIGNMYTPPAVGTYTVTASKEGYEAGTETFTVRPHPLLLESGVENGRLIVSATSSGNPVADLPVTFDTLDAHQEAKTDAEGKITIEISQSNLTGNVTIKAASDLYEPVTAVQEIKPQEGGNSTMLIVILVVLIILIIVILALTSKGEIKKRKEKGQMERKGGSHIGG
ncbi:MAG: carboxypeptidase regulatory-like domain-containing protein [Candidatus Altiarchaeota archaeon]|nr:carboxypeptidase regulatory-like domain-containing protein [Candidatus Altiarchaeota archaeon]